jgi:hypothetical protein
MFIKWLHRSGSAWKLALPPMTRPQSAETGSGLGATMLYRQDAGIATFGAAMRRDPVFIGEQIAGVGVAFPVAVAGTDAAEKGGSWIHGPP